MQPIYCRGAIRVPLHPRERNPAQRSRNNEVAFGARRRSVVAEFLGEANSPLIDLDSWHLPDSRGGGSQRESRTGLGRGAEVSARLRSWQGCGSLPYSLL